MEGTASLLSIAFTMACAVLIAAALAVTWTRVLWPSLRRLVASYRRHREIVNALAAERDRDRARRGVPRERP